MSSDIMGDPPIQVRDPSRIHCLVMPSPRTSASRAGPGVGVPTGRCASGGQPGNMMMIPPIGNQHHHYLETGMLLGGNPALGGAGACANSSTPSVCTPQQASQTPCSITVPGWATPVGYTLCGLGLGLCNLLAPGYIRTCANLLCPSWTLSLALHIVSDPAVRSETCWIWAGVLTLLLLPFVISVGTPIFVGFYLLVFALFSSGMFWQRLQGAAFILAWLCWGGLLVSCCISFGYVMPQEMNLCVAAFFSISLGVINSGGCKFILRVG